MSQLRNYDLLKFRNNPLTFELCWPELGPSQDNRTQISWLYKTWASNSVF